MNRSLAASVPRSARSRAAASLHLQQDSAWRPALVLGVSSLLLLGLAYAVATTSVSRLLFPAQADGSLLIRDGQVRGSQLIAQPFVGDGYFQARPSAANYDPMAAAGSNMARTNPALQERVQAAITAVAAREGVPAAQVQIARVARSRGLPVERVSALVQAHTLGPQWGVFGQPRVKVMTLNVALDAQQGTARLYGMP